MTFSIVARCPETGALGVAVSTAVPAVGAICPYLREGVGAVSTQSWTNPYLALDALAQLAHGMDAQQALDHVLKSDPAAHLRQVGIVDRAGGAASWTGSGCTGWAGQRTGAGYAIQGNMLTGPATLDAMVDAFEASRDTMLAGRLMLALEAGQHAGGDKRGRQSAALKVMQDEAYAQWDIRVDDHADPVAELRRVFGVAQQQFAPFVAAMPTRDDPGRAPPADVMELLLAPPKLRPGVSHAERAHEEWARLAEWMGVSLTADRAQHNLAAYRAILAEIRTLRELDLSELHPAVVFDPMRAYRTLAS
jgi:uncharacterized Ntn-hydrolase superfamily protein